MKAKKNTGVWAYLKASGALDKGDEAIALARREYWRQYDREYKAQRRSKNKEHVVNLEPKEYEIISEGAKKHSLSIPVFLKMASLAYLNHTYVSPESASVRKIEAVLVRCLTAIERISSRKEKKGWFTKENDFEELRKIIVDMRLQVVKELFHPDSLMAAIFKNPARWDEIKKRISHDFKDNRYKR